MTPSLAASLLFELTAEKPGAPPASPLDDLTERERQILEGVAAGSSNKEIGVQLHVTEETVKHHMTNILQKLQVRNRVEAALLARSAGEKSGVDSRQSGVVSRQEYGETIGRGTACRAREACLARRPLDCRLSTVERERQDMATASGPARSVLYLQAKPGMRNALVAVFRRIDVPGNALRQAGCLSVEVQVPPDADGPLLVTALWRDRAAYDGWLANPWREYSGNELAPFLENETAAGVVYDIVLAGGNVSAVAAGAPCVTEAAPESG